MTGDNSQPLTFKAKLNQPSIAQRHDIPASSDNRPNACQWLIAYAVRTSQYVHDLNGLMPNNAYAKP